MNRLTAEERIRIIELFSAGSNSYAISHVVNRPYQTVTRALKAAGIYESRKHREYACDHLFFDNIFDETRAYWLGFIAADGCVKRGHTLQIGLSSKDTEHLYLIKKHLVSEHPVKMAVACVKGKKYDTATLSIGSKRLVTALGTHGITRAKSLTLQWVNTIPPTLMHHFIRGYFDGDGCFWCGEVKRKKAPWKKEIACSYSFTGSPHFIPLLMKELSIACNLNEAKIGSRNGRAAFFHYSGTNVCKRIYKYLYHDATIYLARKQLAAQSFFERNFNACSSQCSGIFSSQSSAHFSPSSESRG